MPCRLHTSAVGLIGLAAVLLCGLSGRLHGQITEQGAAVRNLPAAADEQASSGDPLRFQRLMVPAARPEDWPRDKAQRYLPMPAAEFERRVGLLGDHPSSPESPLPTKLLRATYSAELKGDDLTNGVVRWEFEHRGNKPAIVPLGDCRIPLADFQWVDAAPRAIVGSDQHGRLAALVDRSGNMQGRWSLRGDRSTDGRLNFSIELPQCPINTLQLTLPTGLTPSIDSGVALAVGEQESGRQQWRIELGGTHRTTLQIVKQDAAREARANAVVRQTLTYRFAPHGLELTAQLRLDVRGAPLRRLRLVLDQPLEATHVELRGARLPFEQRNATARDNRPGFAEAIVELPTAVQGPDNELRIVCIAPLTSNTPWRLPLVRVADAAWQEGVARLIVPAPLELSELQTRDCRQTGVEPLSRPETGEAIGLQFFSAAPEIVVELSRRSQPYQVTSGTSVFLRANEGAGRYEADLRAGEGERFLLEARIAPQWIINGVESTPPGMIADWSQQTPRSRPGRLTVQLASPLTADRGMRLTVTGRRRAAPWGEILRADDLSMLEFVDAESLRRVVHVQAAEAYQLQLQGAADLERLDPAHLPVADVELLAENPSGLVFVDDENSQALAVSLAAKAPQYEAEIEVTATVGDESLTESYRLQITPQGREIGRFVARLTQPRREPLQWSIEGESAALSTSRRTPPSDPASRSAPGEEWELTLPSPRSAPFVLRAERVTPFHEDTPLSLASLAGADAQRGTVEVVASGRSLPEIRSRRLTAVPVSVPPGDRYAAAICAFQFDPEEDTLFSAEPPLVLAKRSDSAADRPAWIWQANLQSFFGNGKSEHLMTCRVENWGRSRIQFQRPDGAVLRDARIDELAVADLAGGTDRWRINLPDGHRFVTVVLRWTDDRGGAGMLTSRLAPWPVSDVSVLARDWSVWLPTGVTLAAGDESTNHIASVPWTRRLFGPLARVYDSSPDTASTTKSVATENLPAPWTAAPGELRPPTSDWTGYTFQDASENSRIVFVDDRTLTAWAWVLFVFSMAVRWWSGPRGVVVNVATLGVATTLALLVPAALAPLSAAIWLGLFAGGLLVWFWPALSARPAESRSLPGAAAPPLAAASAAIAVLVAVAAWHELAYGEDADRAEHRPGASQSQHCVLIPVDDDGRPTGGLYYVPELFHQRLLQADSDSAQSASHYLVTAATYHGQLRHSAQSRELASDDWLARFQIESLTDQAIFRLPFGADGTALVPDGVKLDGQPASFHWDQGDQQLVLEIGKPGTHQLEVLLRPTGGPNGYDFAIPPVAATRADLVRPRNMALDVTSAIGARAADEASTTGADAELSVWWLGPAKRLELLRHGVSAGDLELPAGTVFNVEEMDWLRIRPGSVVVDVRLRVNVQSGRLQQLRLSGEPRWQPLPAADGAAGARVRVAADGPNTWVVELPRPIVGQGVIDLSFALVGASGVGQWGPPQFEVVGVNSHRRWCGVSVGPALEFSELAADGWRKIAADQFAQLFGPGARQPQLAFEHTPSASSSVVATRTAETRTFAHYQLAVVVGQNDVDVQAAAILVSSDDQVLQYRVSVPPQMEIEAVAVREQGIDCPLRWSRSRRDLVSVFLSSPADGERVLLIDGRLPLPDDGNLTLPSIRVEGTRLESYRALVLRRPEVHAEISDIGGLVPAPEADFADALADFRRDGVLELPRRGVRSVVCVLDASQEFRPATLQIARNQPHLDIAQATAVNRTGDNWSASAYLDLRVTNGVVDTLHLDLPPQWVGPFAVVPDTPFLVDVVPGENRRQLVLRPHSPLGGSSTASQLRISGPLTVGVGQRPTAPDARVQGARREALFFLLPRRSENQQLAWDTRGMEFKPLPDALSAMVADLELFRSYQLWGDRVRASLHSVEAGREKPQVRLADVALSWDGGAHCRGVAAFDLEPAGAETCQLVLPPGYRLVAAELDRVPAQIRSQSGSMWSVWLGDNPLPRRLEVIFTGTNDRRPGGVAEFFAPTLVDVPVERTIWSIFGPAWVGPGAADSGAALTPPEHERIRFEATAALVDSAASSLLDKSSVDVARWYAPWSQRFAASGSKLRGFPSNRASDSPSSIDGQINAVEQDHLRLARRLGIDSLLHQALTAPAVGHEPLRTLSALQAFTRTSTFAMARGRQDTLSVSYPRGPSDHRWVRYLAAGCTLALTVVFVASFRRQRTLLDRFAFWPQAVGVCIGIIWLIWLTPAVVGWLIVGASLWSVWRPTRRSTTIAPQHSVSIRPRNAGSQIKRDSTARQN